MTMITALWLATRKTDGQDRDKDEIFELWANHLLSRKRSKESIRAAMQTLLNNEDWWPSIAAFERALENQKPRRLSLDEAEALGLL